MADSEFATTVLTSKSPEDVANFLPHSLNMSSTLIEKNLVVWFTNYLNMLIKHNQDLNVLVANGRNFFTRSGDEFGSVDKIWNCVASCVTAQIGVNDSLIKVIKNDVINQLQGVFKSDFRFSELVVNANEAVELKDNLNHPNGDYNWNIKAPAILSNFENYKRYEKGVLFGSFLSYLNTVNAKTAALLHKNENAVNYILKEYNIDAEMEAYTKYVVNTKAPAAASSTVNSSVGSTAPSAPPSGVRNQSSRASIISTPSTAASTKKKSKLRSKMGSILGRKKKPASRLSNGETIPEDLSITSVPSTPSHGYDRTQRSSVVEKPVDKAYGVRGSFVESTPGAGYVTREPAQRQELQTLSETRPLEPVLASKPVEPVTKEPETPVADVPTYSPPSAALVKPTPALPFEAESLSTSPEAYAPHELPNVEKYTSSDDDSDGRTDRNGNRLSMLQAHNLDPPRLDTDSDFRSRNTSSGKYSFEYGDEEKLSASATPKIANAPGLPDVQPKDAQFQSPAVLQSPLQTTPFGQSSRPAPPPSRKVHAAESKSDLRTEPRRDLQSQTFHNLPAARASILHEGTSLVSQTTGSSLFRQNDYFKHFGSEELLVQDGLNTSIAEIVNATFYNGNVTKLQVLGEIAFNYNSAKPLLALEVQIPAKFSKFLLNEQFMHQTGEGRFSVDLGPITSNTLGGLKYMMALEGSSVPVLVKQVWKLEPHQASLIIKISANPAYALGIQLDNVVISAALDGSVTSTSASSKPEGSFNKDKNRITWRYTKPLVLGSGSEEKLIARIMTDGQGSESPTGVLVKFTIHNSPKPYAEILDSELNPIPTVRSLSSGNYTSHVVS